MKLLIATHNQGKLIFYRQALKSAGLEVVSLADLGLKKKL